MALVDEIAFRRFQPDDLPEVRQLHEEALRATGTFIENFPREDLDNITATYIDNGGDFIVGLYNGQIIAMGGFRFVTETEAELKRMRTKPTIQGKGIGTHVLQLLESNAKAKGYQTMILDTQDGTAAVRFYEHHGYMREQRPLKGFPEGTLFYRKELADTHHADFDT